jgi:hypothetical protein
MPSSSSALRQLQNNYNALLTVAQDRRFQFDYSRRQALRRFRHWTQVPSSRNEGERRLNSLRILLPELNDFPTAEQVAEASVAFPQVEWNSPVAGGRARAAAHADVLTQIRTGDFSRAPAAMTAPVREVDLAAPLPRPSLTTSDLPDLTFGIEIECFLPVGMSLATLARKIADAGIPCEAEGYNHNVRNHWKVVTDGSLGDYSRGCEVVSPVLRGEEGFAAVRKACDTMVAAGCTVRRSCGFHVHVGASGADVSFFKNLAAIYAKYEGTICTVLAPSRNGNMYAAPIASRVRINREQISAAREISTTLHHLGAPQSRGRNGSRYATLNFCSYWQHGTVEFRHHQGTVDATKAINWIKLCLRMAGVARRTDAEAHPGADLPAMLDFLAVPADEREYFTSRAAHFAGRGRAYQERR